MRGALKDCLSWQLRIKLQNAYVELRGVCDAIIAQLEEQLICNQQVSGSTPDGGFCRVEKWLSRKAHNLETGGSNPPPAIGDVASTP